MSTGVNEHFQVILGIMTDLFCGNLFQNFDYKNFNFLKNRVLTALYGTGLSHSKK